jgi:hypothetical protein
MGATQPMGNLCVNGTARGPWPQVEAETCSWHWGLSACACIRKSCNVSGRKEGKGERGETQPTNSMPRLRQFTITVSWSSTAARVRKMRGILRARGGVRTQM